MVDVEIYDWPKAIEIFIKYKKSFDKCKQVAIIDKTVDEVGLFSAASLPEYFQNDFFLQQKLNVNFELLTNLKDTIQYRSIFYSAVCGWSYM